MVNDEPWSPPLAVVMNNASLGNQATITSIFCTISLTTSSSTRIDRLTGITIKYGDEVLINWLCERFHLHIVQGLKDRGPCMSGCTQVYLDEKHAS